MNLQLKEGMQRFKKNDFNTNSVHKVKGNHRRQKISDIVGKKRSIKLNFGLLSKNKCFTELDTSTASVSTDECTFTCIEEQREDEKTEQDNAVTILCRDEQEVEIQCKDDCNAQVKEVKIQCKGDCNAQVKKVCESNYLEDADKNVCLSENRDSSPEDKTEVHPLRDTRLNERVHETGDFNFDSETNTLLEKSVKKK